MHPLLRLAPLFALLIGPLRAAESFWPEFMARHDLMWTATPTNWVEGAFLGNGLLGAMITADPGRGLRWEMGRADVTDLRPGDTNPLINKARLPIGSFYLRPVGRVLASDMRLDLWNAEATGNLRTDRGGLRWVSRIHAEQHALEVVIDADPGEQATEWSFAPAVSESDRIHGKGRPKGYTANPPPAVESLPGGGLCRQWLSLTGGYTTAWRDTPAAAGQPRRVLASIGYEAAGQAGQGEALAALQRAADTAPAAFARTHRGWWHAYYPQSLVSLPDTRLESFYWIQMYKLGCASRPDRPAMDLLGPWYHPTLWPAIWWNLNIQLAYSPVYTANRLDQGENYARLLEAGESNLVANARHYDKLGVPAGAAALSRVTARDLAQGMWKGERDGPEVGNLLWACHNYWRQCRYAGDDDRLRRRMLPLLARAVAFHLHLAKPGEDGRLHLPVTYSPEIAPTADCHYDLAGLRWGLETLVREHRRLGGAPPDLDRWERALATLADFPTDANGLRIGRDVPHEKSHRHYSHLLAIYPLHVLHPGQPTERERVEKSVNHWIGMPGAFIGYSWTGAASMLATLGRGREAAEHLHQGLARQFTANTMYVEAYDSPCIESPLSGAQSIHDMLLQSYGGEIHVFPGVPGAWADVVFRDLRAEGAFLLSAQRRQGRTVGVRVRSLVGGECRVRVDGRVHPLRLAAGETAFVGERLEALEPVAPEPDRLRWFGTRAINPKRPPAKPMPFP